MPKGTKTVQLNAKPRGVIDLLNDALVVLKDHHDSERWPDDDDLIEEIERWIKKWGPRPDARDRR